MISNSKGAVFAATVAVAGMLVALLLMQTTTMPIAVEVSYEIKANELGQYVDLAGDAGFTGILLDDQSPADIVAFRAWNTKAFLVPEKDEIKWKIYQNKIHFFDGEKLVDLNRLSYPKIEKKEFLLEEKPPTTENTTRFKIDNYLLHKGITASVNQENKIVFLDAKQAEVEKIASAYAIDSKQNTTTGQYQILQKQQELEIFVDISSEWLHNAAYPIIIDPDTNYTSTSGDGYLYKSLMNEGTCNSTLYTSVALPITGKSILDVGQYQEVA